ncbi:3-(methylthio)propionyl-CoA ligase [Algiphilus sp.]|uniref:3-(methylthio)propionyl-CoA ligase n=1 Tax=Algiphilus sp. TaxID=1872431 RepID=UPI003C52E594
MSTLQGQMMDVQLLVSALLRHADYNHADTEIVSRRLEGDIHRYTYSEAAVRIRKMANALEAFGLKRGERAATLAWNGYRHFELYYAISGIGSVMHTINPRLHPEQVAWIVNHAEDRILFFDITFAPIVDAIADKCPTVQQWVAMIDPDKMPEMKNVTPVSYEDFIQAQSAAYEWPELDENAAAALCYTSGTTGNPKGVLYSHRSLVLHTYAACLPDAFGVDATDVVLPIVPMFHVNAWSLPYVGALAGVKLVFPGAKLDGESVCELFENEKVTISAGVPTVWLLVLQYLQQNNRKLSTVKRMTVGGSACPPALMKTFKNDYGVQLEHAWGMTEMSPLGTYNHPKAKHLQLSEDEQFQARLSQGRAVFGVEMKIVDDKGNRMPQDGQSTGDLHVRGPWVVDRYFKKDESPLVDGWFPTGDVGYIDPDGYLTITDRTKDVIKSGGEWIGSIDIENIAMAHPAVAMAACIAARHEKWDERPLLLVQIKEGQSVTKEDLLKHFEGKIAKWWTPDDVLFVDSLPLGATGKVQKNKLRDEYGDHLLKQPA